MTLVRSCLKLTAGTLVFVFSGIALAEAAINEDNAELETVIVTAQRRDQSLQDVPLAVTTIGGDALSNRGLMEVRDLVELTPGATFTFINAAEPVLSLRGIASGGEGASSDSGVLMMADGEVIPRDFMRTAPIFDVQRVEVLRGPQGTTYGRNATAGVFHVIHKVPEDTYSADFQVEAGNYASLQLNGAVTGPLGDNTRGRAAIFAQRQDGFSEDSLTGSDVDDRRTVAARFSLAHDFTDNLTLLLRAHTSRERHGMTGPLKSSDPFVPFLSPPFVQTPFVEGDSDPYTVFIPDDGDFDRDIWGISSQLNWHFGDLKLISLTAISRGDNEFIQPTPTNYNYIDGLNNADIFSQELRLEGTTQNNLYWSAGLYYLDEDVDFGYVRNGYEGATTTQQLFQTSKNSSLGIFSEVSWYISPRLELTVGARYSRDKKSFEVDNRATGAFAFIFVEDPTQPLQVAVDDDWSKSTFRASASYQFLDHISAYLTYSQGYKSGGFNPEPANRESALTPYDEEMVTNVEAGFRSQLLDDRLQLNITLFDMDYDDIQTGFFSPGGSEIIANIGEASIKGVEVEFEVRPNEYLFFAGALANFDHEYVDFVDGGVDVSGESIAKAPDWTASLTAQFETPVLANAGRLRISAGYQSRSDVNHDALVDRLYGVREGIDNVDLRLAWLPLNEQWELSIWGRNLLDEAEVQYVGPQTILSQRPVIYGAPRTFGATLKLSFN